MYDFNNKMLLLGNPSIRIQKDYYEKYFNQQKKNSGRKERNVFEYDYQRFIWAFILGINKKRRTILNGKTESPFKWNILEKRRDVSNKILGLTLLNEYGDNPERLKEDFLNSVSNEENDGNKLSKSLRIAIEEYANTGFEIITQKNLDSPGYLEDGDQILLDILN